MSTHKFPLGSRVKIAPRVSRFSGMLGTVVGHRKDAEGYDHDVNLDGHSVKELGFKDSELILLEQTQAPDENTTTQTRYRLVWGENDGTFRLSDDLEALQARCSPDHGDYIEYQTITTKTTDWERIP